MNHPVQLQSTAIQAPIGGPSALGVQPAEATTEPQAVLLDLWRSIKKRRWPILGLALAAALLAWVISGTLTPVYRATAKMLIEPGKAKVLSIEDLYRGSAESSQHIATQIEILKSRESAMRVAKALRLWELPGFDPRQTDPTLKQRALQALGTATPASQRVWSEADLLARATAAVSGSLDVQGIRGTQLVTVTFEATNPETAAKVANTAAEQFLLNERSTRSQFTREFNQTMQEQLVSLREKLTQSEKALQDYRDRKDVVGSTGGGAKAENPLLGGMSNGYMQARSRRMELESAYQAARSKAPDQYGAIPEVQRDAAVAAANRVVDEARIKLRDLETTSGTEFYKIDKARTELADAQARLRRAQESVIALMASQYEAARDIEQTYKQGLDDMRTQTRQTNRDEFRLTLLEREYQSNRQFYEQFLNRIKETSVAEDVEANVGRMIDAALPPAVPIKPRRLVITAVAMLLAGLLAAGAAIAMDRLDDTVKGGEDAEQRLKQPLLAALPQIEGTAAGSLARTYLDDAHSHFAEAIRTARTGIMLSGLDTPRKILLVTSSLPGEGKTTVSTNLALAHAQTKRTLLIDCDMRRSQVSRALNMPPGLPGLSNLVAGTAAAKDCIHTVPDSPLLVLPVGDLPPNPLEMLLSNRFQDALKQLSQAFEMIIIDSPPVELVSDALVLAPMATHVSYVVKAMSTPAPLVRRNLTRIQRAGGNLLGVLVNRLDFKHARLYYGEYGASSYAYGGYGGNYGNAYGKGGAYGAGHAKKALAEERARLKQQADEGAQAAADAKAPTSAGVAGGAPSTQPMDKAA